jgi:hypothetical protein
MTPQETLTVAKTSVALCAQNNEPHMALLLSKLLTQLEWRPIQTLRGKTPIVELLSMPRSKQEAPLLYAASYDPDLGWSIPVERRITHWRPVVFPQRKYGGYPVPQVEE